jgi:hypothetical protein
MSAPEIKDFEPPVPTLFDPYPGYYQLPSGEWAMHDPKYYKKVIEQLTSGPDLQTQNKSEAREFAGSSREDMATFDPGEELRQGQIAELEKRKAITTTPADAPAVPRMKASCFCHPASDRPVELLQLLQVQKSTGLARSRHQLSTLLTEAYANREALEEKIAQGKRNRKEAGSKYGEFVKHFTKHALRNELQDFKPKTFAVYLCDHTVFVIFDNEILYLRTTRRKCPQTIVF